MTPEQWQQIQYFSIDEFRCSCGCEQANMDFGYVLKVDEMRNQLGFPIIVNSGYRCPSHNAAVSSTGMTGPHTTGKAADFGVSRHRANALLNYAFSKENGFTHRMFAGIGIKQHGTNAGRFVHLDELSERIWTY